MSAYDHGRYGSKPINWWFGGFIQDLAIVESILRNHQQFLTQLRAGTGLQKMIRAMLLSSAAFLAVYGAVLGSTHSLWQALSSAIKLPILFLITMIICIPALYIFSILFGSRQRLNQIIAVVLSAITVTAVLLLSLAPITFFFMLTTDGYQFFKLLNVLFFVIAGGVGMVYLSRGMRMISASEDEEGKQPRALILVLYVWVFVYAFVGSQMAWTLRPFVGYPGARFELIRQLGGNFYADIFASIGEILGLVVVM
jgi:hypothetical protein